VILTCPTCRQRSRHPPNQMLGRWAICPHCGSEIDWRELSALADRAVPNDELFATPYPDEENER
jgi:hypothetical protein